MKKLLIILAVSAGLSVYHAKAQDEGVRFSEVTYKEALTMAGEQEKLVFVDCYAVWCGPCKRMEENVFPLKEVGDVFNARFVSIKVDVDKNPDLKKMWEIKSVPTFLLLSPDGSVLHRIEGGGTAESFMAKIEQGLNPQKQLQYLEQEYQERELLPSELYDYWLALSIGGRKAEASNIANEVMKVFTLEELSEERFWPFFSRTFMGEPGFVYVEDNLPVFRQKQGAEKIDGFLMNVYRQVINNSFVVLTNGAFERRLEGTYAVLSRIDTVVRKNDVPLLETLKARLQLCEDFHKGDISILLDYLHNKQQTEDFEKNVMSILQFIKQYGTEAQRREAKETVQSLLEGMGSFWKMNISKVFETY